MSDLSDLDFRNWLSKRTSATSDLKDANYKTWFSTRISQGRMEGIAERILSAREVQEKADAVLEGQSAVILYSLLVYHMYPTMPSLRREIDSDPELSANFKRVKSWFDSNQGQRIAKDFYQEVMARSGPADAVA